MKNPIPPQHEQHYPSLVLPHRLEEFIRDGLPPTTNKAAAIWPTGQQVVDAVLKAPQNASTMNIDARYFVGTSFHEGATNEWDTEVADHNNLSGFASVGNFQIGSEEAARYGYKLIDMIDLGKAADCFTRLAEANLNTIVTAAYRASRTGLPLSRDYRDPSGVLWIDGSIRAYLAICHNHGGGFVRTTIANHGLDWAAYKLRNPHDNIVAHSYGEDCVTGGANWPGSKSH